MSKEKSLVEDSDCVECACLKIMFKKNAPKCIVCRGDVMPSSPERLRRAASQRGGRKGGKTRAGQSKEILAKRLKTVRESIGGW